MMPLYVFLIEIWLAKIFFVIIKSYGGNNLWGHAPSPLPNRKN